MSTDNQVTENGFTMTLVMHKQNKRGRTVLKTEVETNGTRHVPTGRIPRISRLMALAVHFQNLIEQGVVQDYAEIARLTGVSRARVTQIMNMNLLTPEVQEEILHLPPVFKGRKSLPEKKIRLILKYLNWDKQLIEWERIKS